MLTFGMWQKRALESKVIRSFIDSGCMTFKKAAELSDEQQNFLDLDVVRKLIQEGILPFDVALNLTWRQQQNLEVPMVVELLRSKDERCCLTLDQVLRLQWMALDNLKSKTVCALLQEGILPSVEKALSLAAEQRQSLELPIVAKLLR
ncbi:hypothetical protein C7B72_23155, partial [Bacillus halotolerans]